MNLAHFIYNGLAAGALPAVLPVMWLNSRSLGGHPYQLSQRLGRYSRSLAENPVNRMGGPKIWLHAASVGEVGVAAAVVQALRQSGWQGTTVLSTTTTTGLAQAEARLGPDVPCFFAPLDWWGPVRRALDWVRPDVLAILETEIWPNLLACAHGRGVRTAIINGRISPRSFRRYRLIKPLLRFALSQVDALSMMSDADAQRIRYLGAPARRVVTHGSAKFDIDEPVEADQDKRWAQALLNVDDDTPVLVAGSTRDPEEIVILDAFKRIRRHQDQSVLVIAPRHVQRCQQVVDWAKTRGLACQLRSQIQGRGRTAPVVVVDTIGELFAIYSVARFVFCGGSLVPKGGQNLLEPAFLGKPVMYGPSMEDFAQARDMVARAGGGVRVENADQIVQTVIDWMADPAKAQRAGQAAREAVLAHRGAARKHAGVLLDLLEGRLS